MYVHQSKKQQPHNSVAAHVFRTGKRKSLGLQYRLRLKWSKLRNRHTRILGFSTISETQYIRIATNCSTVMRGCDDPARMKKQSRLGVENELIASAGKLPKAECPSRGMVVMEFFPIATNAGRGNKPRNFGPAHAPCSQLTVVISRPGRITWSCAPR